MQHLVQTIFGLAGKTRRSYKLHPCDLKTQGINHAADKPCPFPVKPESLYSLFIHQPEITAAGSNFHPGKLIDEQIVNRRSEAFKKGSILRGFTYGLDNLEPLLPVGQHLRYHFRRM